MKTIKKLALGVLAALALAPMLQTQITQAAPFGSAFTYQGRLNISGTTSTNGLYDFRFTLYDGAATGSPIGSGVTTNAVPVTNGLFTVQLDFGAVAFTSGEARWLQLEVNTNGITPLVTLNPRQRLTPTPQAIYAGSATTATTAATASSVAAGAVTSSGLAPGSVGGTAIADGSITSADLNPGLLNNTFWKLTGNVGTIPGTNFIGTTDNQPLEFKVSGERALRLEPRGAGISPTMLGGYYENNAGTFRGVAIAGGGTSGAINQADGNYGFIGAGIGGRVANSAVVGAGTYNSALGNASIVGSGYANTNRGEFAAIVAGTSNTITSLATNAFIGGGQNNIANNTHATVGGGEANRATSWATVGGGYGNRGDGSYATVGGGLLNTSGGWYATVPGGDQNSAAGHWSFAAGRQARANHQGSFVWADSQAADFASLANNQFLIRASGNVGINKPNPATALDVNGTVTATGFSGSGAGLTSLNAANLTGPLADARLSANVALRAGGNNFTGDQVISGGTLYFSDPGSPMIHLFASGILNPDRMVLSHSPSFPDWGLQYQDTGDKFNFRGDLNFPVMTVALESRKVGIGTTQPSASLSVVSPGASELDGSARSATLLTSAGGLGTAAGDELALATIGFDSGGNYASLGIRAKRIADASGWPSTAIGLGMDVDNTVRAGASLWLNANGNVGVGTTAPGQLLQVGDVNTPNSQGMMRFASRSGTDPSNRYWDIGVPEGDDNSAGKFYSFVIDDPGLNDPFGGPLPEFVIRWDTGNVGIGTETPSEKLHVDGNILAGNNIRANGNASVCTLTIRGGCDLAEPFQMSGKDLPKGAVVVIDETNPGHLKLSASAYDTRVAGIISGANGVNPGISLHQEGVMEGGQNVALSGRVYVQADASNGAIKPGDLLTTSATPGHAMKVAEPGKAQGAILGKAMTALAEGKGLVLVLVTLQ